MPQAPDWLREEWPGGCEEAIEWLRHRGYTVTSMITPPANHEEGNRDSSAIDYLILEWDFGWGGK